MWPNPQVRGYLVTFTKEILNEKLHFLCSEKAKMPFFIALLHSNSPIPMEFRGRANPNFNFNSTTWYSDMVPTTFDCHQGTQSNALLDPNRIVHSLVKNKALKLATWVIWKLSWEGIFQSTLKVYYCF